MLPNQLNLVWDARFNQLMNELMAGQSTNTVQNNVFDYDEIQDVPPEDLAEAIRIIDQYELPPQRVPIPPPTDQPAWDD